MANADFELTIVITAIDDASAVLQTVAAEVEQFDASLTALQQDTLVTLQDLAQLTSALGSAIDLSAGGGDDTGGYGDGSSISGFDPLTGDTNPLGIDLSGFSSQQPDVSDQALNAAQAGPSTLQVIQNNTFNGILDPSAIQDQVIPELERAVARGTTLLASA
jgi:hypothetical protein